MRAALPLSLTIALTACGSATPELAFSTADSLAASYELYGGPRKGDVELRRTVKVLVDVAVDVTKAESRFEVQSVLARFAPSDLPLALVVHAPVGAELAGVDARAAGAVVAPLGLERAPGATVDPGQEVWTWRFPPPPQGDVLEVIVRLDVPGTLTHDAQWLAGPPSSPSGAVRDELLLRYDLPASAVGAFQVLGADLKPIVTEQGGRKVVALFVQRAWSLPAAAHARYVTPRASPKGYDQDFATSWASATRDYVRRLVEASDALDEGYEAPFRPAGSDPAAAALAWVHERKGRPGADVPWHAARGLKAPLEGNDLTATDKVHLLHWLLREARVPHRFVIARPARYPHVSADLPVPDAFVIPILAVGADASPVWLDPACTACAPGEVRPELASGQALLLPVGASGPELFTLPATKAAP